MHDHVFRVICAGDKALADYLFDWIARMFQYPGKLGEVAIVLRGKKGAGKGIFFNWIVRAWGQHGIHITHAKHLIGNFNAHLRNCVALFADEAFWPRKSAGALRPRPPSLLDGGFGLTLLIDAQAWINVPSTEKCSLDNNRLTRGCDSTAARNLAAISPSNSRSRFFEKLEWSDTGSSMPRPTNQRNSRSNSIRSISCRSERTE